MTSTTSKPPRFLEITGVFNIHDLPLGEALKLRSLVEELKRFGGVQVRERQKRPYTWPGAGKGPGRGPADSPGAKKVLAWMRKQPGRVLTSEVIAGTGLKPNSVYSYMGALRSAGLIEARDEPVTRGKLFSYAAVSLEC